MGAIFSAFGIDWRLLIVNTVNFALVLGVLWYFLYQPLLRMLDKRRDFVAQGVIDAQNAEKRLTEIERSKDEILANAGREADDVLSKARKAGGEKERELVAQGEAAAARIVAEAEAQAREEKERALAESRQEVAKLVVLGIEKDIANRT